MRVPQAGLLEFMETPAPAPRHPLLGTQGHVARLPTCIAANVAGSLLTAAVRLVKPLTNGAVRPKAILHQQCGKFSIAAVPIDAVGSKKFDIDSNGIILLELCY
jgi:hypothetical protein